ncbi:MAG: glycine--tRNA ligase subunit beta, partial [Clostridia bacterium]|nr:glycine--tRNA ligase subunit beta [Clostridia bacterium]
MFRDLIFEIGTEELPARNMPDLLDALKEKAVSLFNEERLRYEEIKTFGTPR